MTKLKPGQRARQAPNMTVPPVFPPSVGCSPSTPAPRSPIKIHDEVSP